MPKVASATFASRWERITSSTRTGALERAFPRRDYAAMRRVVPSPRRLLRTPRGCSSCIASSLKPRRKAEESATEHRCRASCVESAPTSALSTDCFFAHHYRLALEAQCDVGGGPSGVPPGPELNVSHGAIGLLSNADLREIADA